MMHCIMTGKTLWDTCALLYDLYLDYSCTLNVCLHVFGRYTRVPWWSFHQPGANGGGRVLACSVCKYLYHLLFLDRIWYSSLNVLFLVKSLKLHEHLKSEDCVFHSRVRGSGQSLTLPLLFVTMTANDFTSDLLIGTHEWIDHVNFQVILPHSNRCVQADKGLYNLNCCCKSFINQCNKSTQLKSNLLSRSNIWSRTWWTHACTHFKSFISVGML